MTEHHVDYYPYYFNKILKNKLQLVPPSITVCYFNQSGIVSHIHFNHTTVIILYTRSSNKYVINDSQMKKKLFPVFSASTSI